MYCTVCGRKLPEQKKMKPWKKALIFLCLILVLAGAGFAAYDQLTARRAIDRLAADWEEGRIQDLMETKGYQAEDPKKQEQIQRLKEKYGLTQEKAVEEDSILNRILTQTQIEIEKPKWIGKRFETTVSVQGPDMEKLLEEIVSGEYTDGDTMTAEIESRVTEGRYQERTVSVPVTLNRQGRRFYADPSMDVIRAFYGGMVEKYTSLYEEQMEQFFSESE